MNAKAGNPRYKVQWKVRGQKDIQTRDMIMAGRTEVIRHLEKSEGVTTAGTDFLYIHEHRTDGTSSIIMEYERDSWADGVIKGTEPAPVVIGGPTPPPHQAQPKAQEARIIALKHSLGRYYFREATL